jgi:alkanesulfonate monooxygenase SsuD/methylene tetrahydromethanopterin reductase-like flavin-dependent oxidoreductase (luciferase family)
VRFGVHLPLLDFGGQRFDLDHLVGYAETATELGFDAVSVNDHLVFGAPWLDGPTALAAVLTSAPRALLFTTVANPVVRGPVALAKALAALDVMSGGRVVAGLGPGSSERDYACVGIPFAERWPRFDEAVRALRAVLSGRSFDGGFYEVHDRLEPRPVRPDGPPLWIGSWGSEAGLRRAARLGDGWLASAYNTTPPAFATAWRRVRELREEHGRDSSSFANGLATMWFHLDDGRGGDVLTERLLPVVRRPEQELRERLGFGPAERLAETLAAFGEAGVQRVFLWPVADELEQLRRFREQVVPLLPA